MTDFDEKWKEYRNRAIQALGTAIVITLIVVANIGLIACIGRLSAQQTKYLLYAQCGLVDLFGTVVFGIALPENDKGVENEDIIGYVRFSNQREL